MSLRFDKYFSGQTGGGGFASDPGRGDVAAFIRQADAAYDLLRDQPQADPRALLIAGHSEGGLMAMLVDESGTSCMRAGVTPPRGNGAAQDVLAGRLYPSYALCPRMGAPTGALVV